MKGRLNEDNTDLNKYTDQICRGYRQVFEIIEAHNQGIQEKIKEVQEYLDSKEKEEEENKATLPQKNDSSTVITQNNTNINIKSIRCNLFMSHYIHSFLCRMNSGECNSGTSSVVLAVQDIVGVSAYSVVWRTFWQSDNII